jgi:inorganic pyrophosphatase
MGFLDFLFGKPKTYDQGANALTTGSQRSLASRHTVSPQRRSSNVLDLRLGGVVTYNTTDFIVTSRYVYEDHGFSWFSYHFVDTISGEKLWIDAQDDDELEIAVVKPVRMSVSAPVASRLVHAGITYHQDEHGYAKVLIESQDSDPKYSEVEYWDFYDDEDEKVLGVERWGDDFEVSAGHYIEPYELTILSAGE